MLPLRKDPIYYFYICLSLLETKLFSSNRMLEPEHHEISFWGKKKSHSLNVAQTRIYTDAVAFLFCFVVYFADKVRRYRNLEPNMKLLISGLLLFYSLIYHKSTFIWPNIYRITTCLKLSSGLPWWHSG